MPDFNVRSDSVNVEQIMEQIRARVRDKRGVDYTEEQIHELAAVRLEKFLDPKGVRSDLLEQFRREQPPNTPPALTYALEAETIYESHRWPLVWIRKLLRPVLKLFFNPNPLIHALHIQAQLNTLSSERDTRREAERRLYYEVLHNLVIEMTRMGIEVKNLRMRVESLTGRLEFNERRARALESVVVYKPADDTPGAAVHARDEAAPPSSAVDSGPGAPEGPGQRSRRRRRRRGRRGGGSAVALMGAHASGQAPAHTESAGHPVQDGPSTPAVSDESVEPSQSFRESAEPEDDSNR